MTCSLGNLFQTKANDKTQHKPPKIVEETCDKPNGNGYNYDSQDMNQIRDSKIMSENLNLVPNQKRPPQAKTIEYQQTLEEKHENILDKSPRMKNQDPIIINVEEAKETACQQQVQLIKYQRRENNIKSFERTRGEAEESQQKAKELLFQQQILENKRIEDQLIKVRISRQ